MAGNRAVVSKDLPRDRSAGALQGEISRRRSAGVVKAECPKAVTNRSWPAMVQCFPWPSSSLASKAKATMIKLPPA
jgi:hypothetical protein